MGNTKRRPQIKKAAATIIALGLIFSIVHYAVTPRITFADFDQLVAQNLPLNTPRTRVETLLKERTIGFQREKVIQYELPSVPHGLKATTTLTGMIQHSTNSVWEQGTINFTFEFNERDQLIARHARENFVSW